MELALQESFEREGCVALQRLYERLRAVDTQPLIDAVGTMPADCPVPRSVWLAQRRRARRACVPLRHHSVGSVLFGPESQPPTVALTVPWNDDHTVPLRIPLCDEGMCWRPALVSVSLVVAAAMLTDLLAVGACSGPNERVVVYIATSVRSQNQHHIRCCHHWQAAVVRRSQVIASQCVNCTLQSCQHEPNRNRAWLLLWAGDVCTMVFSACGLICPPVDAVLKRAYPYCSLTNMTFLTVDG